MFQEWQENYILEPTIKFILTLDNHFLPLTLPFLRTFQDFTLSELSKINSIQSHWLQWHLGCQNQNHAIIDAKYDEFSFSLIHPSVMKPEIISQAISDIHSPFFQINLQTIIQAQNNFSLEQLVDIAFKVQNMTLLHGFIKSSNLSLNSINDYIIMNIKAYPESQLFNWIKFLVDLNGFESLRCLEGSLELSDAFWEDASIWLAEHSSLLKNCSPNIINRIHRLENISPSFLLRYATNSSSIKFTIF